MSNPQGRPIGRSNRTVCINICTVCGEEYKTKRAADINKCTPCSGSCASIIQRAKKEYRNNTLVRCNVCLKSMSLNEIGEHIQDHLYKFKIERLSA